MEKQEWKNKQGLYCQKCDKDCREGIERKNSEFLLVEGEIELLCQSCVEKLERYNRNGN